MQITKNYQLGIICFLACVIFAIAAAMFGEYVSGALSAALVIPCVVSSFVCFCLGVFKTFKENDFIDTGDLEKPIKLKFKGNLILILLMLAAGFYIWNPTKPIIRMYNTNIAFVNQYEKIQQERKMFYDKMWKTYLTKNEICEVNRETFIDVTSIIMQGRSDGQNVSWKIVHENQPIPYDKFASFYAELSNFVTSQREEYYKLENQAMNIIQQQNSMLDSFPNNMYNKVLNIEKLKYSPGFTSNRTEAIFKSHKEEI